MRIRLGTGRHADELVVRDPSGRWTDETATGATGEETWTRHQVQLRSADEARRYLHRFRGDAHTMRELRHALAHHGVHDVSRRSDDHVVDAMAREIAEHHARLFAWHPPPFHAPAAADRREKSEAYVPPPAPTTRTKTWIEIELVDESGEPVPYQACDVTAPNGSVRHVRLDGCGRAYVDDLDPGTCKITFTELDTDAWAPA